MIQSRPIWCPNIILLDSCDQLSFPIDEAKSIIKKLTKDTKLITVYINHEFSNLDESQIVVRSSDYAIYKETNKLNKNVTSEFLKAGSNYVYYIKTDIDSYRAAFIHVFDLLFLDYHIICVSNNLASHLQSAAVILPNKSGKDCKATIQQTMKPDIPLYLTSDILSKNVKFRENEIEIN